MKPLRYSGRLFSPEEIDDIRRFIADGLHRSGIAKTLCERFRWVRPDGQPREMSARVALLRMHRDGLICLPPPRHANGNRGPRVHITSASDPATTLTTPVPSLRPLRWEIVRTKTISSLWNELIHRYHYLGYKTLPGAQLRYLVFSGSHLLAALGFGAAAWKVAPRDSFIGWSSEHRVRHLHRVVNNARFLILPWVRVPHLASTILSAAAKRLPDDWRSRYGYAPVLLETFIDKERFRGTCYKAANWIHVGQTQGRGKLDRLHQHALPIKDIFLYPLHKRFRQILSPCDSSPR